MKDSCFIRRCSGLSSQEPGANGHLRRGSSIALPDQWHRRGRRKPLLPLQLFCRSVVVGRRAEPEDLDNFEFNIRNDAQLNLMTSLSFPFSLEAASVSLCSFWSRWRPGQLQLCADATGGAGGGITLGYPQKNYGLEPGASKCICRLTVI